MFNSRRPWQEELSIIDQLMKAVSGVTDPEELVNLYWNGISELLPIHDYLSVSRRGVDPPGYFITRSSRFVEHHNPWTQRDRLPKLTGGLLGEIAYAERPVIIDDLPARLAPDDPAHFFLEGFGSLVALPQYDGGVAMNVTMSLLPPGREIDHAMIPMMHWQTGLFGRGTTNLVLRNQLTAANAALDRELQIVGKIQRSLLPRRLPPIDGFDLATHYETSARAGGDYYDFFPLGDGCWGIFIADVAGHGAPAAVLMAITHAIAHATPGTHAPPVELLTRLNDQLARVYTRGRTFITAFYAVLDPKTMSLTYCSAGHNPPRIARRGRVISLDDGGGLPLGILADQPYVQSSVTLEPRDLLLLYTDGIVEAMAPRQGDAPRELFGVERLDELLLACNAPTAESCIHQIRAHLAAFSENAPPNDDRTLIAIRCK